MFVSVIDLLYGRLYEGHLGMWMKRSTCCQPTAGDGDRMANLKLRPTLFLEITDTFLKEAK